MKARDVMVRNVITVGPDAMVQDIARLLLERHVSAVPVVGKDGALIGIISENDLMRRPESGTQRHRAWWLQMMTAREVLAKEFSRSHAMRAEDVMTRRVITARPDTLLRDIADLLEKHRIKRVPIVDEGKLVGIVSRANLLQALASSPRSNATAVSASDDSIRDIVVMKLDEQPWAQTSLVNVIVHAGTVDLWGIVSSEAEKDAMRVVAEVVPGVKAVNNNLSVREIHGGL
jgi:CBS domain-containing protein